MFLGEYKISFSGKGRIVLPRKLRKELKGESIILSRGFENCVWGFSPEDFEKEAEKTLGSSATEERARYLRRYLFASSVPVELDSQGRFVIPSALLTYAKLENEIVVIGTGDHFEIWNNDLWKKHLELIEREYAKVP